ncbi:hypothetical protein SAMN02745146_2830 [Hymenobacter daecheongensis DSM 21074]|uniref:Ribonuclease VapC n=1 Tax=Hymenobacter daecheongensis DSM 21074 TaxID=1121955 RepID=A0A1M6I808_9BACT|nr:type II toxin-antitoxin system VapC family toxin [Hymenobacter daecheongensis]SHJ30498.1 hypothetical protein SAMN02745146_2830 [Hymenobacter daecheongensis DSM 21074]
MGARYAVDTNVGIDFLAGALPADSTGWLESQLNANRLVLSVVVRMELLSWRGTPAAMQLLEDFIAANEQLPIDEPAIQQTILLRQQHRIKLPDAIIAATALAHGLPLLTRNTSDFSAVPGLQVLNPYDAGQLQLL